MAQAVLKLGRHCAYEGRMLLRSMIEIHINYAWIRVRESERRANRFLQFESLERLKVLKDLSACGDPARHRTDSRRLISRRAKVRHLFRNRDKQGKLQWDTTWSSAARSVESRLREVLKCESGDYDPFLYGFYRWTSSAIHGGPISLDEVVELGPPLRAKSQPEGDPAAQIVGAFVVLMAAIEAFANDTQMLEDLEPELAKLRRALKRLRT